MLDTEALMSEGLNFFELTGIRLRGETTGRYFQSSSVNLSAIVGQWLVACKEVQQQSIKRLCRLMCGRAQPCRESSLSIAGLRPWLQFWGRSPNIPHHFRKGRAVPHIRRHSRDVNWNF